MKLKKIFSLFIVSSLAIGMIGCSPEEDKAIPPGTFARPTIALTGSTVLGYQEDCEASWSSYVETHPVGLLVGYKASNVKKTVDGTMLRNLDTNEEYLYLESNTDSVAYNRTVYQDGLTPYTLPGRVSKAGFLSDCAKAHMDSSRGAMDAPTFDLTADARDVAVEAGDFLSDYYALSVKTPSEDGALHIETWALRDGSTIIVKSINEQTHSINGVLTTTILTKELTKLVQP